ncbi:hypothetical protein C8J55DRAFT_562190 [Lentinula edodes]|uniref:Uncharacterized protein n=1 Tax=Lentinula lateritia TaxID=40482 RepID=A0A9W9A742_9AGAR|nr:hypothetical protein C8J55DRAFT_562190 [Lentinula edodes]
MSVALTTQSGPLAPASVCVYCAASPGNIPAHRAAAVSVGTALARAGRTLIYGGSSKGLMGIVSSSCLKAGGDVTGIIPYAMAATGDTPKFWLDVYAVNCDIFTYRFVSRGL